MLKGIFSLIRPLNLLYIGLAQYLIQYCLIRPLFELAELPISLNHYNFFLLVLSTMIVGAAGYIINDYFDVKIDEINRPNKIVIDRLISRRKAMALHLSLNLIGLILSVYLAWVLGKVQLVFIHVFACSLLWFYSTTFKKWFLIGNILVSLVTALVIFTVWAFEPQLYASILQIPPQQLSLYISKVCFGFFGFAFIISMIREIIKDMEDQKGDRVLASNTIPISWGIPKTKILVIFLIVIMFLLLVWFQVSEFKIEQFTSISLVLAFIQIPLIYLIYLLILADKPSDFRFASNLVKAIMLFGMLYLVYLKSTIHPIGAVL